MIDAFRPADPLQTMLVGQAVMFNELLADGARDVLAGMTGAPKLRAQSNLNGMNRSLHQNLGLFLRLRDAAEAAAAEAAREAAEPPQPRATAVKTAVFTSSDATTLPQTQATPAVTPAEPSAEPAVAREAGRQAAAAQG